MAATRIFSGVLLIAGVVAALWWLPPLVLLGLAVMVGLLAFGEYIDLAARAGVPVSWPAGALALILVSVAVAMPGTPLDAALTLSVLGMAALSLAQSPVRSPQDGAGGRALQRAAVSAFGPMYIGLPLGLLVATRWSLGREAALLVILIVALSDTCQYYSGRLAGRRPLAPLISPKKTVEGAIGGIVGAAIGMAVLGQWWLPHLSPPALAALGLIVAAAGIIGDLFESMLKRSVDVKDSSSIIPGHGGVLDRIDALLFAAPAFYIIVRYSF